MGLTSRCSRPADPKKDPTAMLIPEIEAHELLALDLSVLAVERSMQDSLKTARSVREVVTVNGLVCGNNARWPARTWAHAST